MRETGGWDALWVKVWASGEYATCTYTLTLKRAAAESRYCRDTSILLEYVYLMNIIMNHNHSSVVYIPG